MLHLWALALMKLSLALHRIARNTLCSSENKATRKSAHATAAALHFSRVRGAYSKLPPGVEAAEVGHGGRQVVRANVMRDDERVRQRLGDRNKGRTVPMTAK